MVIWVLMLRIATRKSPLALWQAESVRAQLLIYWPLQKISLIPMVTSGDRWLQGRLQSVGGKGLFVKELEEALLDDRADFAVHSMKDVPAAFPAGLGLAAICKRDHPLDAFISLKYKSLNDLPIGACIGTSSLRRQSQLLAYRPDLVIHPLRGNINTRIKKLEAGEFDGIILARAGLERMGLVNLITETLSENIMLPACGQGALGIECKLDRVDLIKLLAPLNDLKTAVCVKCEREVNRRLGGNCHVPLAVYCQYMPDNELYLQAKIVTPNGDLILSDVKRGPQMQAMSLSEQCANDLLANGADELLKNL